MRSAALADTKGRPQGFLRSYMRIKSSCSDTAVDCGEIDDKKLTQMWIELPANVLRCRAALQDGLADADYQSDVDAAVALLNEAWDQCKSHP